MIALSTKLKKAMRLGDGRETRLSHSHVEQDYQVTSLFALIRTCDEPEHPSRMKHRLVEFAEFARVPTCMTDVLSKSSDCILRMQHLQLCIVYTVGSNGIKQALNRSGTKIKMVWLVVCTCL